VQRKLQILGFNRPSATSHPNTVGEVKTAFRDQCKILHPDCGGNEQAFREVNEAYMALMAEHSLNIESSTRRKPHYQPPPSAGSAAQYSSTYGTRSSQGSYYNFNSSGQRSADGSFRSHYGGMSDRQREMWRRRQAEYEEQQQQHQYQGQGNQQQTYASHEDSQAEADYQAYSQRHPEGSPENYTLNFLTYVACFGTGFLCYYWSYNAGDHRAAVASALQPAAPAGYFPPREFPRPEPHIPVEEGAPRYLHPKDAKQIQVYLASQDYRGQSWPDTQPDVNPLPGVQTTVSEHKEPHTYKLQDQWEVKAHMAHQIFDPKGHADMIKAAQREKREERERLTKEKLPKLMEVLLPSYRRRTCSNPLSRPPWHQTRVLHLPLQQPHRQPSQVSPLLQRLITSSKNSLYFCPEPDGNERVFFVETAHKQFMHNEKLQSSREG